MNLNENIKKARTNMGMDIKQLSQIANISVGSLEKYESGEIENVPSCNIRKIARALQVTEVELKEGIVVENNLQPDTIAPSDNLIVPKEYKSSENKFEEIQILLEDEVKEIYKELNEEDKKSISHFLMTKKFKK